MHIIVGLGNPGDKYKETRHNAGFMAVDALAEKLKLDWETNKKFKSEIVRSGDLFMIKPETFMNESGKAVKAILNYYKLLPKKFGMLTKKDQDLSHCLTVIHDDLDIEPGKFKISSDSRSAGHNGVQSIIDELKTKKFRRLRIGIKPDEDNRTPASSYVLEKFKINEKKIIGKVIDELVASLAK